MQKVYTLLYFILLIGIAGCSSKRIVDLPQPKSLTNDGITMKVSGIEKKSSFSTAILYTSLNEIQVGGQFGGLGSTEGITLSIRKIKVGPFSLNADETIDYMAAYQSPIASDVYANITGSGTITAYDGETISGTFQFRAKGLFKETFINVTEGAFKCKIKKM